MSTDDRLADLRRRLDALDEQPLATHPDTLAEVLDALVAELDDLAGVQRG